MLPDAGDRSNLNPHLTEIKADRRQMQMIWMLAPNDILTDLNTKLVWLRFSESRHVRLSRKSLQTIETAPQDSWDAAKHLLNSLCVKGGGKKRVFRETILPVNA